MFRKRDEIDSTSRYHPPPRGGCRLGFGGQSAMDKGDKIWLLSVHSFSNSEPWKEVNIQFLEFDSVLESINDMSGIQLPVIPSSKHAVKKCKIQDIQKQLEFIPAIYRGYYEKVIQQNMANEDDDNNTELSISDNDLSHDNDEQEVSSALVCKRIKWFASVLLMLCCTVLLAGKRCILPH